MVFVKRLRIVDLSDMFAKIINLAIVLKCIGLMLIRNNVLEVSLFRIRALHTNRMA